MLSKGGIGVLYRYILQKGLPVAIELESLQSPRFSVGEMFGTVIAAKVLVERWRREYNHIRPHSSLGYRPPAPEVVIPRGA